MNLKVNPETSPEHAEAQRKYGVNAYPTIAFLSADGDLISLNPGYRDADQFAPMMEEVLHQEKRLKQLRAELQKTPNDPAANAELALLLVKRGNLEMGQPFVDKALKLDPNNKSGFLPDIHLNLGLHYGMSAGGDSTEEYFQNAENHFNTVIQKYPRSDAYEQAQYYLGVTYAIQEKYQLALATLEKLTDAKDPDIKQVAATMRERVKDMAKSSK